MANIPVARIIIDPTTSQICSLRISMFFLVERLVAT